MKWYREKVPRWRIHVAHEDDQKYVGEHRQTHNDSLTELLAVHIRYSRKQYYISDLAKHLVTFRRWCPADTCSGSCRYPSQHFRRRSSILSRPPSCTLSRRCRLISVRRKWSSSMSTSRFASRHRKQIELIANGRTQMRLRRVTDGSRLMKLGETVNENSVFPAWPFLPCVFQTTTGQVTQQAISRRGTPALSKSDTCGWN